MDLAKLVVKGAVGLIKAQINTHRANERLRHGLGADDEVLLKTTAVYQGGFTNTPTGLLVVTNHAVAFEATSTLMPFNTKSIHIAVHDVRSATFSPCGLLGLGRKLEIRTHDAVHAFLTSDAERFAALLSELTGQSRG